MARRSACLSTDRVARRRGRDELRLAGRSAARRAAIDRDVDRRLVRYRSVRRPSILTSGGGTALAAGTGLLANTRFLPMGFAIAPSMKGAPLRRFLTGALLADASFVIGHRGGGRFDIRAIAWAAPLQYLPWIGGTVVGVVGADAIGDPTRWGLDVLFPVFYLSLLLPDLFPERFQGGQRRADGPSSHGSSVPQNLRPIIVALLAAAITLCLTPIAPPGVPVVVAAAAALIGLRA